MGTTARTMSMDIVFNNQKSDKVYKDFCRFKQTSDKIIKTRERFDRVSGWHIRTPISKLLGVRKGQLNAPIKERPWEGVFVPMVINSESSDQPNLINCRIDLIENNVDFYSDNEIILTSGEWGGSKFVKDGSSLKWYFDDGDYFMTLNKTSP